MGWTLFWHCRNLKHERQCGGDQNPQPRGELELAEHHGSTLALAVKVGLRGPIRPIEGTMQTVLEPVDLEFATPPGRVKLLSIIP